MTAAYVNFWEYGGAERFRRFARMECWENQFDDWDDEQIEYVAMIFAEFFDEVVTPRSIVDFLTEKHQA